MRDSIVSGKQKQSLVYILVMACLEKKNRKKNKKVCVEYVQVHQVFKTVDTTVII